MIALIRGVLLEVAPNFVILETHGVGYKIFIPSNLVPHLPQINQELVLYTSLVIRENSQALYGFSTSKERDFFETLMDISGIGPKLALSVISTISAQQLHAAILKNDIRTITKIPGIGKKTAERLIIELRDKIAQFVGASHPGDYAIQLPIDPKNQTMRDAVSALINLGYTQMAAQKAIKSCIEDSAEKDLDLPQLITQALSRISG
jgi:Holliday junction DNA helicase RuvA